MKSVEQQKHVNNAIDLLLNKSTTEHIQTSLKRHNISNSKVKEIIGEAENSIQYKFGGRIKRYLLKGTLESNMKDFSMLSSQSFEKIKNKQIEYIKYEATVQIKQKVIEKELQKDIIDSIGTNFYSIEEIKKMISDEKRIIKKKIQSEKLSYYVFGTIVILICIPIAIYITRPARFLSLSLLGIGLIAKGLSLNINKFEQN